jgi:hypothetical protein
MRLLSPIREGLARQRIEQVSNGITQDIFGILMDEDGEVPGPSAGLDQIPLVYPVCKVPRGMTGDRYLDELGAKTEAKLGDLSLGTIYYDRSASFAQSLQARSGLRLVFGERPSADDMAST